MWMTLIICLYVTTVIKRGIDSKRKCWLRHRWIEYSPKYLKLDMYLVLAKLDLMDKEEYLRTRRTYGIMKGGMTSYYLCPRCKCKKTHTESL